MARYTVAIKGEGGVRFGEKFLDEKNLKKWRRRVVEVCDWWGFCGGIKVDDSPWL
jgi:hypothetical protein